MQLPGPGETPEFEPVADDLVRSAVPGFAELPPEHRARLCQMAAELRGRGMPETFVVASLRSTAQVLADLEEDQAHPDNAFQREEVRRFIEENALPPGEQVKQYTLRRERKREERESLHANTCRLLREARQSRARHEVKKTRNMLLKVDQRELRRVLGREGDELCRQINTWLRSTSEMF